MSAFSDIVRLARPLHSAADFDALLDRIVAVEGDWPDCFRVNRWVKGRDHTDWTARRVLGEFDRWPTWMWANEEVAGFADWLRRHNASTSEQVGFYGLDVYKLWESMRVVLDYLAAQQPHALEAARAAYACFEPYAEDPQAYAYATRLVPTDCQDEVVRLLTDLRRHAASLDGDPEAGLDARQNAEVLAGAEHYYRTMVRADSQSWNVRDHHMADTLERLLDHHGASAKAIVWEHNTHVGDARATPMSGHGISQRRPARPGAVRRGKRCARGPFRPPRQRDRRRRMGFATAARARGARRLARGPAAPGTR